MHICIYILGVQDVKRRETGREKEAHVMEVESRRCVAVQSAGTLQ